MYYTTMKSLTGRERLLRIFRNEEIDRPGLKLWGFRPYQELVHPDYKPVVQKAAELTDWFFNASSDFNMAAGLNAKNLITQEIKPHSQSWNESVTTYHTPKGNLIERNLVSLEKKPGYTIEHAVKEPEDLEAILSMPYEPIPIQTKNYFDMEAKVGEKGVTMFGIDNASYYCHRLMGSEVLAFFSIDYRELLCQAVTIFSERLRTHVRNAIDAGIRGIYNWVGPELFIPPLMTPVDFETFVYGYDKAITDLIHDAGGHVWLHCHGKVNNFIERFIDMGIDVLNPLEPPKNGDINMFSLVKKYNNRMGWEGNIEIQDILQAEPERLRFLIRECVDAGAPSGRFILSNSAGCMEYPVPGPEYIRNLLLYLDEGFREVEKYRK